jgi:Peptidase family M1 domain
MQMKINISVVALVLIIFSTTLFCQDKIFVPRNILTAYENGARSFDGKPGPEYWQNNSDYKIEVEVDPATHLIRGSEEITYHNNSPDSLKRIVLRLYPNIFKKGNVRDYAIDPAAVDDGLTVSKISIDGRSINLENSSIYKVINTLATIYLPGPIPPKSSINLSIDWSFKISDKATLRVGVYDSTTAFVGYWYPQVSVYDDIDGWDYNNYDGQTEFYNDFSNYEVSITIPNKFGVWATGILQNPELVLQINFLVNYKTAQKSDSVIRIITSDDLNYSEIYNTNKATNTWIFKAANVTDFAFAFSDHYLWDGIRTFTDSLNDKQVFVQAIYPVESIDFNLVAEIGGTLVNYFSKMQPAINYPASSLVIFNNGRSGGGMEFPMMINDGSPDEIENTVALTAHEMAHQYFPFFVGTNEQKYAFMDEAWAVMLPFKYMQGFAGINSRLISTVANYEYLAGTEDDIPPMVTSLSLTYVSYRNSAYNRPSIAYETLRDFLGDELFIRALKEYIHRWNGKHPTPYDFFFTFENVTGQNLSWFWKPWFFDFGYPDLAIKKVEAVDGKTQITIQRLGNVPIPIKLKLIYENESTEEIYYSADIWKEGIEEFKIEHETVQVLKEIQLGDVTIPDSNRENNIFLVH